MNQTNRRAVSVLQILIPSWVLWWASANATDFPGSVPVTAAHHDHSLVSAPRKPLDLRAPPLLQVMSHSELLDAIGTTSDQEESVEIVAEPQLLPMSSDADAPLGIVDAVHWSIDHPSQTWRVLLPATSAP
jgi:hypothetical protein